ncbi:hypothetical protein M0Q50_02520 [bacterium]|jgi:hypothetical protein|nr:hypothetical protein [bacterium]
MKYYYKTTNNGKFCIEDCTIMISENKQIKIGSHSCKVCTYIIDYNDDLNYVICKKIIKFQRLKKLNSL